jgi:hypothetical protein
MDFVPPCNDNEWINAARWSMALDGFDEDAVVVGGGAERPCSGKRNTEGKEWKQLDAHQVVGVRQELVF